MMTLFNNERCGCEPGEMCSDCASDEQMTRGFTGGVLALMDEAWANENAGRVHNETCCMNGVAATEGPHPDCTGVPASYLKFGQ